MYMTRLNSDYLTCLESATIRYDQGKLKLCPRGYCTAKNKFKVYPSAYANGYAVQVCKGTKPDLNGMTINDFNNFIKPVASNLERWYQEKWVNVCQHNDQGNYIPCGRKTAELNRQDYPYCRPVNKLPGTKVLTVGQLSDAQLKQMCHKKRQLKPANNGKPSRVYINDLVK